MNEEGLSLLKEEHEAKRKGLFHKVIPASLKEAIEALPDDPFAIPLGQGEDGKHYSAPLDRLPNLIVAGGEGNGKSHYLHSLLVTLLLRNKPEDMQFVLIDSKKQEFARYAGIPHLRTPIVSEKEAVQEVFAGLLEEVQRRFALLDETQTREVREYNDTHPENKLPKIIVFIDSFDDAFGRNIEKLNRLAQRSRLAGIHIILADRFGKDGYVPASLTCNFPSQVVLSYKKRKSRMTLVNAEGATKLKGEGEALLSSMAISSIDPVRCRLPFISEEEIAAVIELLKK